MNKLYQWGVLMKKIISLIIVSVFVTNSVGCGTILHPERKGQVDGRIDPSIAVLDGIGLLFFLIPGVIAFAVDFSNGTIYLPGTEGSLDMEDGIREVHFEGELDMQRLKTILERETGQEIEIYSPATIAIKADSLKEAKTRMLVSNKALNLVLAAK